MDDLGHHLVDRARCQPRQRRIGAHAAGVGTLIIVTDPFEILGRLQRQRLAAVGDHEQARLRPVEVFLDDDLVAAPAVLQRSRPVGGDQHTFTGRQSVVLDDVGCAEPVEGRCQFGLIVTDQTGGGRDAGIGHHLLRERFRTLQPGRGSAGAEASDARGANRVGHARHQGRLGADDHQIRPDLGRQTGDRVRIAGVDGMVGGEACGARVAGRHMHLGDSGIGGDGSGQRVFAAPRAHHENGQPRINWRSTHLSSLWPCQRGPHWQGRP